MVWMIPAAMAASALIGGGASIYGGMSANSARQEEADQANKWGLWMQQGAQQHQNEMANFNANQARITRDWQENLSNTAYRRAMTDMRASGLNPILAYQQGGATSPSGATGSGSGGAGFTPGAKADVQDAISPGVSSAMQAVRAVQGIQTAQAEIDNMREQNTLIREQAGQASSQANLARMQGITEGHRAGLVSNQAAAAALQPALVQAQTDAASSSAASLQEGARGQRLRNDDYQTFGPEGGWRDQVVRGNRISRSVDRDVRAAGAATAGAIGSAANSARDAAGRISESFTVRPEGFNQSWRDRVDHNLGVFRRLYEAIR